jgi:hypothetical protein
MAKTHTYIQPKENTPGSTMAKKQRDDHKGLCSQCVPSWHPRQRMYTERTGNWRRRRRKSVEGVVLYKSTHKYGNDTFSIAIYKVRFQKENGKIPHTIDPSVSSGVPNSLPTVHILSWSAGPARSTQILLGNVSWNKHAAVSGVFPSAPGAYVRLPRKPQLPAQRTVLTLSIRS